MVSKKHTYCSLLALFLATGPAYGVEYLPGIEWPEPAIVNPGATNSQAPSDAVVLFDGTNMAAWEIVHGPNTSGGVWYPDAKVSCDGAKLEEQTTKHQWEVKDGTMIVGGGGARTKQHFGDCQLHIEWSAPPSGKGAGQHRGNSGVFLAGRYEIQVLDSFNNKTYFDGQAAGIYKQTPPMVNVMRKPGEWNAYDIIWQAPRFNEDGSLQSPAYITALHNGVLTVNHFELQGDTPYNHLPAYKKHPLKGPIGLQDHGHPVRYRNIWIREFKPIVGKQVDEPSFYDHDTDKKWQASGLSRQSD